MRCVLVYTGEGVDPEVLAQVKELVQSGCRASQELERKGGIQVCGVDTHRAAHLLTHIDEIMRVNMPLQSAVHAVCSGASSPTCCSFFQSIPGCRCWR